MLRSRVRRRMHAGTTSVISTPQPHEGSCQGAALAASAFFYSHQAHTHHHHEHSLWSFHTYFRHDNSSSKQLGTLDAPALLCWRPGTSTQDVYVPPTMECVMMQPCLRAPLIFPAQTILGPSGRVKRTQPLGQDHPKPKQHTRGSQPLMSHT